MIPSTYKPKKKFMQLAIAEAKRARDRGDYAIGAVITQLIGNEEVVIASAGNRVKTSGSSIKHVELETLKYVSSGYGRYLPDFVLYSTHEPCAMCAGACVWSKIGAVVFGVSQEDITAYGNKHGTEQFKWRACLISCKFVLEKGSLYIPVFDGLLEIGVSKVIQISSITNQSFRLVLNRLPQGSVGISPGKVFCWTIVLLRGARWFYGCTEFNPR